MTFQNLVLIIFIVSAFLIAAVFFWIYSSTRHPDEFEVKKAYPLRKKLFLLLTLFIIIFLLSTFQYLPYAGNGQQPDILVNVTALQFQFNFNIPVISDSSSSQIELPANKLIEFRVTSKDVNHGFGIYNSDGVLLGQTQAMPGYVNKLRIIFTTPGKYHVLCMEYCGSAHQVMRSDITVK